MRWRVDKSLRYDLHAAALAVQHMRQSMRRMLSGDVLQACDAGEPSGCAVQELSLTLGMAYLAFYVANSPQIAGTSGVIAVVVMGIYGSATGKWDMSPRFAESGFFYR